jgi:hypothetical protein
MLGTEVKIEKNTFEFELICDLAYVLKIYCDWLQHGYNRSGAAQAGFGKAADGSGQHLLAPARPRAAHDGCTKYAGGRRHAAQADPSKAADGPRQH